MKCRITIPATYTDDRGEVCEGCVDYILQDDRKIGMSFTTKDYQSPIINVTRDGMGRAFSALRDYP